MPGTTPQATHVPPPPPKEKQVLAKPPSMQCQIIDVPPLSNPHSTDGCEEATWTPEASKQTTRGRQAQMPVLLRKEVIQPHLPVRLPCYDLVPIASPTFDGSSP